MMQSYVDKFLSLKCSGDVLNVVSPVINIEKEISESMALIKHIKQIVLCDQKWKYNIIDLCAGNALTSVLASYLLPINFSLAIDKKPRERNWTKANNFAYLTQSITEDFDIDGIGIDKNSIIISSHPCKLARTITEIYNKSEAKALVILPCCTGPLKRVYPNFFKEKIGNYLRWCYDLSLDVNGTCFLDNRCTSPMNCVVTAIRK